MTNADISVSMSGLDHVVFTRGKQLSENLWDGVVTWWLNGAPRVDVKNNFEVPFLDFVVRMEWLRTNWSSLGRSLEIHDDVKTQVGSARGDWKNFLELSSTPFVPVEVDYESIGVKRSLTDFQNKNLSALLRMPNGADFSVPGAGKTMTSLVLWRELNHSELVGSLLVVCPRSAFEAWSTESELVFREKVEMQTFSNFAIRPRVSILLVNYEQLENPEKLERLERWVELNRAMLIIDEAHRIKGGGASVRWKACKKLSLKAMRTDMLTGTPMPQDFDDLRNLYALSWKTLTHSFLTDVRLKQLKRGGVFVRTTKNELELPPIRIPPPIVLPMGTIQAHVYAALKRVYVGRFGLSHLEADAIGRRGRAALTLLGVATNPGLLMSALTDDAYLGLRWPPAEIAEDANLMDAIRNYANHEFPNKYDWVRRFVENASRENRKVLVWSTFVGNLKALARVLEPHEPVLIHGSVGSEDRKSEIRRFRESADCSVLLTNPQTLGEGISLHHHCHDAIYVDRSYNAGHYLQSLDRIHRLGLPANQETNIFLLETENTIDRRISLRLERKIERLAGAMNDDGLVAASLPSDEAGELADDLLRLDDLDAGDLYHHLMSDD